MNLSVFGIFSMPWGFSLQIQLNNFFRSLLKVFFLFNCIVPDVNGPMYYFTLLFFLMINYETFTLLMRLHVYCTYYSKS